MRHDWRDNPRLGDDNHLSVGQSGVSRILPDPEPNSNWDPRPARCPECREIIDAHPAMRKDARWEGWCQNHGTVIATYEEAEDA